MKIFIYNKGKLLQQTIDSGGDDERFDPNLKCQGYGDMRRSFIMYKERYYV